MSALSARLIRLEAEARKREALKASSRLWRIIRGLDVEDPEQLEVMRHILDRLHTAIAELEQRGIS